MGMPSSRPQTRTSTVSSESGRDNRSPATKDVNRPVEDRSQSSKKESSPVPKSNILPSVKPCCSPFVKILPSQARKLKSSDLSLTRVDKVSPVLAVKQKSSEPSVSRTAKGSANQAARTSKISSVPSIAKVCSVKASNSTIKTSSVSGKAEDSPIRVVCSKSKDSSVSQSAEASAAPTVDSTYKDPSVAQMAKAPVAQGVKSGTSKIKPCPKDPNSSLVWHDAKHLPTKAGQMKASIVKPVAKAKSVSHDSAAVTKSCNSNASQSDKKDKASSVPPVKGKTLATSNIRSSKTSSAKPTSQMVSKTSSAKPMSQMVSKTSSAKLTSQMVSKTSSAKPTSQMVRHKHAPNVQAPKRLSTKPTAGIQMDRDAHAPYIEVFKRDSVELASRMQMNHDEYSTDYDSASEDEYFSDKDELAPVGERCPLCNIDLAFTPIGRGYNKDHPVAAILPCGHFYHAMCLAEIGVLTDLCKDPPCFLCS